MSTETKPDTLPDLARELANLANAKHPVLTNETMLQEREITPFLQRAYELAGAQALEFAGKYFAASSDLTAVKATLELEKQFQPEERRRALCADELAAALKNLVPDKHCTCHFNPPCSNCVGYGEAYAALENHNKK